MRTQSLALRCFLERLPSASSLLNISSLPLADSCLELPYLGQPGFRKHRSSYPSSLHKTNDINPPLGGFRVQALLDARSLRTEPVEHTLPLYCYKYYSSPTGSFLHKEYYFAIPGIHLTRPIPSFALGPQRETLRYPLFTDQNSPQHWCLDRIAAPSHAARPVCIRL